MWRELPRVYKVCIAWKSVRTIGTPKPFRLRAIVGDEASSLFQNG